MLRVYVYRSDLGDCTNGGVSAHAAALVVVNVDGPATPVDGGNVMLVAGPGGDPVLVPAVLVAGEWTPVGQDRDQCGPMFGGNYAASSDSRWCQAAGRAAIPVHDRFETWAQYRAMSM